VTEADRYAVVVIHQVVHNIYLSPKTKSSLNKAARKETILDITAHKGKPQKTKNPATWAGFFVDDSKMTT